MFKLSARAISTILACLLPVTPVFANPCAMDVLLLVPLTGPASSVGTDSMNAARMAHQDLPDQIRNRMTLRFDDTQMRAAVAVSAFKAALTKGKPDAVVVGFSESTNSVAPLAGKEHMVMLGVGPSRQFLLNNPFRETS
jgi:ABC-type branched-subunit amino acid transport system substrate-binding protein